MTFIFPYIGKYMEILGMIIPTGFHIFQRGGSNTNQIDIRQWLQNVNRRLNLRACPSGDVNISEMGEAWRNTPKIGSPIGDLSIGDLKIFENLLKIFTPPNSKNEDSCPPDHQLQITTRNWRMTSEEIVDDLWVIFAIDSDLSWCCCFASFGVWSSSSFWNPEPK